MSFGWKWLVTTTWHSGEEVVNIGSIASADLSKPCRYAMRCSSLREYSSSNDHTSTKSHFWDIIPCLAMTSNRVFELTNGSIRIDVQYVT